MPRLHPLEIWFQLQLLLRFPLARQVGPRGDDVFLLLRVLYSMWKAWWMTPPSWNRLRFFRTYDSYFTI